jgi:hypothetical protein
MRKILLVVILIILFGCSATKSWLSVGFNTFSWEKLAKESDSIEYFTENLFDSSNEINLLADGTIEVLLSYPVDVLKPYDIYCKEISGEALRFRNDLQPSGYYCDSNFAIKPMRKEKLIIYNKQYFDEAQRKIATERLLEDKMRAYTRINYLKTITGKSFIHYIADNIKLSFYLFFDSPESFNSHIVREIENLSKSPYVLDLLIIGHFITADGSEYAPTIPVNLISSKSFSTILGGQCSIIDNTKVLINPASTCTIRTLIEVHGNQRDFDQISIYNEIINFDNVTYYDMIPESEKNELESKANQHI